MLNNGIKVAQDAESNAQFQRVRDQSVTDQPRASKDGLVSWTAVQSPRGPILPPWGTRQREWALRLWDRHEYNTLWQGAASGLIKRWCATPWVIEGGKILANRYQRVFRAAMSGEWVGWDTWLASVARNFLRYDGGAWIEVVGGGDPRGELTDVTGLNVLDSYATWPTGDPEYPCVYFSRLGKYNLMHRSRVIHLVDYPDNDNLNPGYGLCALSRTIAVVERQMHEQRYISINLDDIPSSGVVIAENVTPEQVQQAYAAMQQRVQNDMPGQPGNVVWIYALNPAFPADLKNFTFSRPPEKFDWEAYLRQDVNMMALAIGEDPQDLWPLASSSMGSGMQSEVLAKKGKGKMYGNFLALLERELNGILPETVEFQFKIVDPDEAVKEATVAKTWGEALTVIGARLSLDEGRRLLSDNVEQIQNVVTTEAGMYVELPDYDIRPIDAGGVLPNTNPAPPDRQEQPVAAGDTTPNASAAKGLETDEQRRWFFAHLGEVTARGGNVPKTVDASAAGLKISRLDRMNHGSGAHTSEYTFTHGDRSVTHAVQTHSRFGALKGNPLNHTQSFEQAVSRFEQQHGVKLTNLPKVKPIGVSHSDSDYFRLTQSRDAYHAQLAQKDYDATRASFVANLTDLIHAGGSDEITRRRAGIVMRAQLNSSGKAARADGLADGGVTTGLSDADLKAHADWLVEQSSYVPGFLNDLYQNGLTDAQMNQHAEMWANKSLQSAYYGGLQSADSDGTYEFVGEDGDESCVTCRSLKGTKMRLSEWTGKKLLPRVDTDNYECKGYMCQHRLQRVEAAKEYDPAQPRDEIGRWTDAGGSFFVRYTANPVADLARGHSFIGYSLDKTREEAFQTLAENEGVAYDEGFDFAPVHGRKRRSDCSG